MRRLEKLICSGGWTPPGRTPGGDGPPQGGNRPQAYGQRNPLIEYQKEGYDFFLKWEITLRERSVTALSRPDRPGRDGAARAGKGPAHAHTREFYPPRWERVPTPRECGDLRHYGRDLRGGPPGEKAKPIVRETPKVGRNDPCPCGSGKKYKKCHGKVEAYG